MTRQTDQSPSKSPLSVARAAPQRHARMTGYVPGNATVYRAYNLIVATCLVIFLLPLVAGIAITLRITQGPNVIARSPRLGLYGQAFDLFNFRIGPAHRAVSLSADDRHANAFGGFLRTTGLHEMPQLFNVIKGEMNLIGPRPVRPAIAKIEAARDPLYNTRFSVKPGMFGHTQSFMCRGASQRLRDKLTYRKCRTQVNLMVEMGLILRVLLAISMRAAARLWRHDGQRGHLIRARRKAQDWQMMVKTELGLYPVYAFSQGLLTTPHLMTGGPAQIIFTTHTGGVRKASVDLARLSHLQGETVFHYVPAHENAVHLINRYLRADPVVTPRTPRWQPPGNHDLTITREVVPAVSRG